MAMSLVDLPIKNGDFPWFLECLPEGQSSMLTSAMVFSVRQELLEVVAEKAGVDAADILDVDLCLMDSTPPCRIGPARAIHFCSAVATLGNCPVGVMFLKMWGLVFQTLF